MNLRIKKNLVSIVLIIMLSACIVMPDRAVSPAVNETTKTSTPVFMSITLGKTITTANINPATAQPADSMTPTVTMTSTEKVMGQGQFTATNLPECESTILPTPQVNQPNPTNVNVLITGRFDLCFDPGRFTFDLDKGIYDERDILPIFQWESENYHSETDIGLEAGPYSYITGTREFYIRGVNQARVNYVEADNFTPQLCEQLDSSSQYYPSIEVKIGNQGCVVTNEGRIALIKIERIDSNGLGSVELTFTTYNVFILKK